MNFGKWLKDEIRLSGLSMRALAKQAGISHTIISLVINGRQAATRDFCSAIARGLGKPEFDVMYRAGLVPESERPAGTFTEPGMNELVEFARTLTDSERYQFLNVLRALHEGRVGLYVAGQSDDSQPSCEEEETLIG